LQSRTDEDKRRVIGERRGVLIGNGVKKKKKSTNENCNGEIARQGTEVP